MKECLGVKPLCPNGITAVCNTTTGEWVCQSVAGPSDPIENKQDVEQSEEDLDGSKERNGND